MIAGPHDGAPEGAPFRLSGTPGATPIVVAVPHAGRAYTPALIEAARVPLATLARLEDRYADRLADGLAEDGHAVIVAQAPRAAIDLNRHEQEWDPAMVHPAQPRRPVRASSKVRGGLGLIPRRLPQGGELWRNPLGVEALEARIGGIHRPYHAAIARLLSAARLRHGAALLIDLHSMPPLGSDGEGPPARLVIGDRFGQSASARLVELATMICGSDGDRVAINTPYAGGYSLEAHGAPGAGLHAIQIEVDRGLYLDSALMEPGESLTRVQALLRRLAAELARELGRAAWPLAAE